MIQINVSRARQDFLKIMNRVYQGEEFLIFKNNIPIGKIVAVGKKAKPIIKRSAPKEVFGVWKDRWPKNKTSTSIVREWRRETEKRAYDR